MNAYPHYALITAGTIFGVVALMHLLRLIFRVSIIIAGKIIPLWVSGIGFIFPLLLSVWMFIASFLISGDAMALTLKSSAFNDRNSIPSKYTCDGNNISPPLSWQDQPKNTKSFVLIVDDPDAPIGNWDHWIIFNIPATAYELSEDLAALPSGAQYGKNSWGQSAYGGPCPPNGEHRYFFKLYALDTLLNLSTGATKSLIEASMKDHILDHATLVGLYKK